MQTHSLLDSRWHLEAGIHLRAGEMTMAEVFKAGGYRTVFSPQAVSSPIPDSATAVQNWARLLEA